MKFLSRTFVIILMIGFSFLKTSAQKEAWHWYFGNNAGLDFSSGSTVAVTNSAMSTYEGVASISDSTGNLLFYTDGQNVFDATHNQMPNGFGLVGHPSATQSAIIVKQPGSSNLYYIFTVDYNHDGLAVGSGFNYSVVDMNLNSSLGDVLIKNVFVRGHVYEKISAVKHGNNTDYWILINDWYADDIYAYLLDSSGFNMIPVASNAGPFHNQDAGQSAGYIKANRQGNKLALAMWQKASYDLLDFDNLTGIASNHILIQSPDMNWTYGVEFSPDGNKLYGSELEVPSRLFQFDLNAGSAAAILASRVTLGTSNTLYYYSALQLAPDGKIYCAHRLNDYIGVINQPDSSGVSCNSIDNGIYLSGMESTLGLPNFVPDYVLPIINIPVASFQSSDTAFCEKQCIDFINLSLNNATSWQWFFPGANSLTSTLQNPASICYPNPGNYDVTLIACNIAGCDTLTFQNFIHVDGMPVVNLGDDTLICNGDSIMLDAGAGYTSYLWQNGSTDSSITVNTAGTYFVTVTNQSCSTTDSIIVSVNPCNVPSVNLYSTDTNFCEKQCIDFFDLSTNNPTSWQWFFPGADSAASTFQNPTNICYNSYGSFDVTLIACNAAGCDTLLLPNFINEYPAPVPTITQSNDTLLSSSGLSYQWWNVSTGIIAGATNSYYIPTTGGDYYVIVTDSIGCAGSSNVITVSFAGINQVATGNYQLAINPNPNDGSFTISLNDFIGTDFSLRIINSLGQGLCNRQWSIVNGQFKIDVKMSDAAKGLYAVEIINGGKVYRGRFVIRQD